MKSSMLIAIVVVLLTALAIGCHKTANTDPAAKSQSSPAANSTPDEFAATRQVYSKQCANCHGGTGEGGVATVDGKKIKGPPLRSGHALKHPDSDFVKQITKGGDGMPPFGEKLSAQQINDLIRFIRKDFQGGSQQVASLTQ